MTTQFTPAETAVVSSLAGKRVVITRAAHQSEPMIQLLQSRGAETLPYPCIAIVPSDNTEVLDKALYAAVRGEFDWLILTSANTVHALAARLDALKLQGALAGIRAAALGTATAQAAQEILGLSVECVPEDFLGSTLANTLNLQPGVQVLLPQGDIALPKLAHVLEESGAHVLTVTAYCTTPGSGGVNLPALLAAGSVNAITFTSPSTVRNFLWRLVEEGACTADLQGVAIACIGVTTAQVVRQCGLSVDVTAPVHTIEHLVESLEDYFS